MKKPSAIRYIAVAIAFFVVGLTPLTSWSADKSQAGALLDKGLMAYDAKQYDQAIDIWTESLAVDPSQHKVYFNRGMAWFKLGQNPKALADFTQAIEKNPDYAAAYTSRGYLWNKIGEYEKAKGDFISALTSNPDMADPYYQLARIYALCPNEKYRDGEQAVMWALKTRELRNDPQTAMLLAAAYAENGNFKDAITTQQQAIDWLRRENMVYALEGAQAQLARYKENRPLIDRQLEEEEVKDSYTAAPKPAPAPVASGFTEKPVETAEVKTPPAPAPKPAPAATPVPAPAQSDKGAYHAAQAYPYVIQVSAYKDSKKANDVALDLKHKGDAAFTAHAIIPEKGEWYRVFVGYYPSMAECKAAVNDLKARHFTYAMPTKKPWTVSVGDYNNEQALNNMEKALLAKGYLTYRLEGTGGSATRLAIGAYGTAKEANRMSQEIQNDGFPVQVVKR
ncbi:MAG: SPOR domain-containing protein [Desulfatibacillum sp.]|nr:SPOR domain-containing protein [Desulfatibacillum sp.]